MTYQHQSQALADRYSLVSAHGHNIYYYCDKKNHPLFGHLDNMGASSVAKIQHICRCGERRDGGKLPDCISCFPVLYY